MIGPAPPGIGVTRKYSDGSRRHVDGCVLRTWNWPFFSSLQVRSINHAGESGWAIMGRLTNTPRHAAAIGPVARGFRHRKLHAI